MIARGGTYMMEKPAAATPKSSETDPPAANQPAHQADEEPTPSASPPADDDTVPAASQVVPGKPDGEVDTRS